MLVPDTLQVFLLIIVASFIFSAVLSRIPLLQVPSTVSYLVFGMMLHRHALHLTGDEVHWINHLGNFGLLFLMFLSGLEVNLKYLKPSNLRSTESKPLYQALALFLATLLTSYGAGLLFSYFSSGLVHPWMVTLLLATTSLGIIVPILEETGALQTTYGQTLLLSALLADLFTMFLVSLFVSRQTASNPLQFLLTITIIPVTVLVAYAIRVGKYSRWIRYVFHDTNVRLRGIVALLAAFCAFASFTGSERILGSFLVGILVTAIPFANKRPLLDYCHAIGYGFLIPIFFISVGMRFDFGIFESANAWYLIGALSVAAIVVKFIPAQLLKRQFGNRLATAGGFLLTARLSLVVAAAQIGVRIGALPQAFADSMVLVSIMTCLIAPILFVMLYRPDPPTFSH